MAIEKVRGMFMSKKGFTLAEVLITLVIIGVIAALTLPITISSIEQMQFKSGLKKAVNSLNKSIMASVSTDSETPLMNANTYAYLMRHMSVIKTSVTTGRAPSNNYVFYTTDGMRFEFEKTVHDYSRYKKLKLHESETVIEMGNAGRYVSPCGSYGLKTNPSNSLIAPCYIIVDVNGDNGPSKYNSNLVFNPDKKINSKVYTDVFPIMITDTGAYPFGVIAQRAMYDK